MGFLKILKKFNKVLNLLNNNYNILKKKYYNYYLINYKLWAKTYLNKNFNIELNKDSNKFLYNNNLIYIKNGFRRIENFNFLLYNKNNDL
jgi:hypothetical protein